MHLRLRRYGNKQEQHSGQSGNHRPQQHQPSPILDTDENKKDETPKNNGPVSLTERYLPTEVFSRTRMLYENG